MPKEFPSFDPLFSVTYKVLDAKETFVVCIQHLLPSIEYMFERLLSTGVRAENVFVLGKPYSTVESVVPKLRRLGIYVHTHQNVSFEPGGYQIGFERLVDEFWLYVAENTPTTRSKILILDEGGHLRARLPEPVFLKHHLVGIEHTSSGAPRHEVSWVQPINYPVLLLARSFAKTRFESKYIVDAIVGRLIAELGFVDASHPSIRQRCFGIVGLGHLGRALAKYLREQIGAVSIIAVDKNEAVFHDDDLKRIVENAKTIPQLVERADVILGCTGNRLDGVDRALFGSDLYKRKLRVGFATASEGKANGTRGSSKMPLKTFASCSSGDQEFWEIIRHLKELDANFRRDPFRSARGDIGQCDVKLLNGGFPLNFDRLQEYEPVNKIRLTRELTFAGLVQGLVSLEMIEDIPKTMIQLSPKLQMEVVTAWAGTLFNGTGSLSDQPPALIRSIGLPFAPPEDLESWIKNSEGEHPFAFEERVHEFVASRWAG